MLEIILAGFNVDKHILDNYQRLLDLLKKELNAPSLSDAQKQDLIKETEQLLRKPVTPETLSASYARLSRDQRPIPELREDARQDIEKARKSNKSIVFDMCHHSIAEHAVFNIDMLGVSRYAVEFVEARRLCAYTEKSQRYQTLTDDFMVPKEIQESKHHDKFLKMIKEQNDLYHVLLDKLLVHFEQKFPDMNARSREGLAKEDARYVVSLATEAQLGETISARNLEYFLMLTAAHPLKEVQELGQKIHAKVYDVAPSLFLFLEPWDYYTQTRPELEDLTKNLIQEFAEEIINPSVPGHFPLGGGDVCLVEYDVGADETLVSALLFQSSKGQLSKLQCDAIAECMNTHEMAEVVKTSLKHITQHDAVLREFEIPTDLTYEITMSSSCFAQMKRHRMMTLLPQDYNPELGYTVPPSIVEIGMSDAARDCMAKSTDIYEFIKKDLPDVAPYILTNGHQRRILVKANPREIYHISRMREDEHAQWDIRDKAQKILALAKQVNPLIYMLACGKHEFDKTYAKVFEK